MRIKKHFLKDYQPLPYRVNSIHLYFDIFEDDVIVKSKLNIDPLMSGSILKLDGEAKLLHLSLNGKALSKAEYKIEDQQLVIEAIPEENFILEIVTQIFPSNNKSLMGLYVSKGNLFTQCEAEGFRKITYFFDRPDMMTEYVVTIEADQDKYPILLSNGNLIKQGKGSSNRYWVVWHDPFKKPCYLFALVAGQLAKKEDEYVTMSGKKVAIHFYCEDKDIHKVDFAIQSLKKAMEWDEKRFQLEYDLNLFMVVAVSDFNMGAMENKGLNIFNTKYVLGMPQTATDKDFANIESVIGHEYFHNYTGNRVTCRDWFQLTLKEGLTVFREQEFSSDMTSRAAKRIETVKLLRELQFPEDAGPLAHPIRPEEYEQINNFYTTTVYEKGAEVIRMIHTFLGEDGFQKGMQLYFKRHDGQAVTCEDFLSAMADANQLDLSKFFHWYTEIGTPVVVVEKSFRSDKKIIKLKLKQKLRGHHEAPLMIPVKVGFLTSGGEKQNFKVKGTDHWVEEFVICLKERKETFEFEIHSHENPVLSIGRGFSAPIRLKCKSTEEELLTLMLHDVDEFNRWEAAQILYKKYIKRFLKATIKKEKYPSVLILISILNRLIREETDYALLALLLELPGFNELVDEYAPVDPVILQKVILDFQQIIAVHCLEEISKKYQQLVIYEKSDPFGVKEQYHPKMAAVRALINVFRIYLVVGEPNYLNEFCLHYDEISTNMTHRIGILKAINHINSHQKDEILNSFVEQFKQEELVLDKYFALIASSFAEDTFEKVKNSLTSPYFEVTNPNKVSSLLITFTRNPLFFHDESGIGYELITKLIIEIEKFNPMVASRLVSSYEIVNKLDKDRQKLIKKQITHLLKKVQSSDVLELANKIYNSIK